MSFICLKLICVPFHLRIKSKLIPMVYEVVCDWTRFWLSHLMLYPSPPPRSNLSTLSLFHLSCSVHTDFSVSRTQGHHVCTVHQVVHCGTPGGAFSRLQGEWRSLEMCSMAAQLIHWALSPCKVLVLAGPSAWHIHLHSWLLLVIHWTNIPQNTTLYQAELAT